MYRVFIRTWWKNDPEWSNGLKPHVGPKYHLKEYETEEAARAFCEAYNDSHSAGRFSRKAEYEKE